MKKIFIGIDVSKETLDVTMIISSEDGFTVSSEAYVKVGNSEKGFSQAVSFVRKNAKKTPSEQWLFCCETTGGYDNKLCQYLYKQGFEIWREHAKNITNVRLNNGKDDKSDSRLIADYAMRNRDRSVAFVPRSEEIEDLRQLAMFRRQLVNTRMQLMVRKKEIKSTMDSSKYLTYIFNEAEKDIERLTKQIAQCEKQMVELLQSSKELSKNYKHVLSIPGIGLVNAAMVIIYSDNFKPLYNSRHFASYCGIAPFYERSGTSVNKRKCIKGNSNGIVRSYLNQAAHVAARLNPDMVDYRLRMEEKGKPHGVIITNIANKLLHIMYALAKNDCDFEKGHEKVRKERLEKERKS